MSCSLSKHACITNIRLVKTALTFTEDVSTPDDYSIEAWNSGWDDDTTEEKLNESVKLKREDQSWLQDCISSLSPAADVLALAFGQHAVFFTLKWDTAEESEVKAKFVTSFEGKLTTEKDENVSSLLCLPLASQKRSLQGGPDWTCIIAGFTSGYMRIYTENAEILLSQKLHEEPIGHLRCKTHVSQHFSNYADQPDELVIVFSTVVVIIDGFGLFQTLRACRNQLARAAAGRQEVVHPPPLSYKKWGFHEHDKLLDCEAAGVMNVTPFDHLVTESIRKGFYGAVKPNVPSNSLLVTTGCNPYVGYYHASEGNSQLLLTDVVQAVASKFMNFISNYNAGGLVGNLIGGFNQQKDVKAQPKIEPATILPLRFGLYDKRRQGISITLSPNKCLAAITDAFGRVILFDVFKGVAVRMWKGYRDAQCGWVEVEDAITKYPTMENKKRRRVFFLVIYAPRRGILEVWCTQQGPRVAAFNVGKTGRLFCPGYAMVGGNIVNSSLKDDLCSCYFLDIDGLLKKVVVPFHLVLSEKNSKRARDLHLLRELKLTLKDITKGKTFEIIKILRDMKTSCTRIQALEYVLNSRHSTVDLVQEVVTALLSHLRKQDPLQTDHEAKLLQQSCVRALQLLKLYIAVGRINSRTPVTSSIDSSFDVQMYSSSLCISETEVGRILSLVMLHLSVVPVLKRQVRFTDDSATEMTFPDFVMCFIVHDTHLVKNGEDIVLDNLPVNLNIGISGKQIEALGGFLFHSSIYVGACFSTLQMALKESGILPEKLLLLLLKHWVSDAGFCPTADKWINLQQVMKHISSLSDPKLVNSDSHRISPWWASVREALLKATGNVAAFVGAIVARSVSVIMAASFHEHEKPSGEKKNSGKEHEESGESDWESVSLDLEHWNLLVKQLEDVLMLNILLKSQPYGKAIVKDVNISIETILNGGQGSVTDLVAVWVVSVGLEPEVLSSLLSERNADDLSVFQNALEQKPNCNSLIMVKGILNDVRKKFPHSLSHDALLANCFWEHLIQWSKNKDYINHLEMSLNCLNFVGSSGIKNGFACMMWKTCILKSFEALALLMEKVGKTPKDRLCRKELEMSDSNLESYLDFCCQLLNIILETNISSEVEQMPKFPTEHFWQGHENSGRTPLITMAITQKASNNQLVYIHFMLSTVLHLIVTFQMKSIKPFSLFSPVSKKVFFHDIHHQVPEQVGKDDQSLKTAQTQFLIKVTSAVAQSIPEKMPDSSENSLNSCVGAVSPKDYSVASKWFNCILDLGRSWEVDLDEIRRHYVCELYSGGQDLIAHEVKSAVTNQVLLSSQLLMLVSQRVHKLIYDSADPTSRLGVLTPDVSSFIRKLGDIPLRCNNVPLPLTANLLDQILAYLPENNREQKLAVALKSAIEDLSKVVSNS